MIRKACFGLLVCVMIIAVVVIGYADYGISNASSIEVGKKYVDHLTASNDYNYYKFSIPSAGLVGFSFSHEYMDDYSVLWDVFLVDEEDKNLLKVFNSGNKTEEISDYIGLPAGTYYVLVDAGSSSSYSTTEYKFAVNYIQSDKCEVESNDDKQVANTISLNTEYTGTVNGYHDDDYYRFVLQEPGQVKLSLSLKDPTSNDGPCYVYLNNANDKQIYYAAYDGFRVTETTSKPIGLPAGTYFIHVAPNSSGDIMTYNICVDYTKNDLCEKEFNDNIPSANLISTNEKYLGTMLGENDKDYYCFSLTSSGYVCIRFEHEYVDVNRILWEMSLMNSDGKEYLYKSYMGNELKEATLCFEGLPEGKYYLRFNSADSSAVDYEYAFGVYAHNDHDVENEFNDNPHAANMLYLNEGMSGFTSERSGGYDKDYYRFEVSKEGAIDIEFKHYVKGGEPKWTINLLNDRGNLIESFCFEKIERAQTEIQSIRSISSGVYYIQIEPENNESMGEYRLTLQFHEKDSVSDVTGEEWICSECGQTNTTNFCIGCGAEKNTALVCPNCGAEIESNFVFCGSCGIRLKK